MGTGVAPHLWSPKRRGPLSREATLASQHTDGEAEAVCVARRERQAEIAEHSLDTNVEQEARAGQTRRSAAPGGCD